MVSCLMGDSTALASAIVRCCPKLRAIEIENSELTKLRDWLLPMLMNGQAKVE